METFRVVSINKNVYCEWHMFICSFVHVTVCVLVFGVPDFD